MRKVYRARYDEVVSAQAAMTVRQWKAGAALRPFVEAYSQRVAALGTVEHYHALPARSDCFLEFYFADRYRLLNADTGAVHRAPRCVLVGPHSRRREDLLLSGRLDNFTIRFSPVGFRAIFGIPARMVRDFAGHADGVLGAEIGGLQEELAEASGEERVRVAETFLLERLHRCSRVSHAALIGRMAQAVKGAHGAVAVASLAQQSGLSTRQVERMFQEHVGLAPKTFGRLARIARAVKLGDSGGDWATIAMDAGYFDQSHMAREFRELIGETPAAFAALRKRAAATKIVDDTDVAFVLSGERTSLLR